MSKTAQDNQAHAEKRKCGTDLFIVESTDDEYRRATANNRMRPT